MTCPGTRERAQVRAISLGGTLAAIVVAALALFVALPAARGGTGDTTTEEHFVSLPLTPTSHADLMIVLPQFDAAQGTLVGVRVCQRAFGDHFIEITSADALEAVWEARVRSELRLLGPPGDGSGAPLISQLSQESVLPPTTLAPGETATVDPVPLEDIVETDIPPPAWGRYVGDAGVQFRLEVRALGEVFAGSANWSGVAMCQTGARISVAYTYVPN